MKKKTVSKVSKKKAATAPSKAKKPSEKVKKTSSRKTSPSKKTGVSQKKKPSLSTAKTKENPSPVKKPKKVTLKKQQKLEAERKLQAQKNEEQWHALNTEYKKIKPTPYSMSKNFSTNTVLMHKKFGWGFILSVKDNRLHVLFKEGPKNLISDLKS